MPDHSQFNVDHTYPGLWTITSSNPPINMFCSRATAPRFVCQPPGPSVMM